MRIMDWVTLVGLAVSLTGLVLGFMQLRSTKRLARRAHDEATAAQHSIEKTERHLRQEHAGRMIEQLWQVFRDVERAVQDDDARNTADHLWRWCQSAPELVQLLEGDSSEVEGARESLKKSVPLASQAARNLASVDAGVAGSCKRARSAMADACDDLLLHRGRGTMRVSRGAVDLGKMISTIEQKD